MASTDANGAAASSSSDPSRPFLRHRRRRLRRRMRSPRRRIPRGIIDSSSTKLVLLLVVLLSVAAFVDPRRDRHPIRLYVEAVVELTTTLGGFRAGVLSTPASFGATFENGASYESYMFLPPGDDDDKFLCDVPLRRRRRRHRRRLLRNDGRYRRRSRRNAIEEAADVLYRAVTGRDPPGAASDAPLPVAADASSSLLSDDDEGRRRRKLRYLNNIVEDGKRVNLTAGNVTQFPVDLPLALLVSRGGSAESCTFETKARNAMALNDVFRTYASTGTDDEPSISIEVLVVHDRLDSIDTAPDRLVQMAAAGPNGGGGNDNDPIDLRLVFVSSRSGAILRRILKEDAAARYYEASAAHGNDGDNGSDVGGDDEMRGAYLSGSDFVPFENRGGELTATFGWHPPPVAKVDGSDGRPQGGGDGRPGDRSSSSNGNGVSQFLFIRYVLFAVLIVAPIVRGTMLWFEGGGRIRFRRDPDTHRVVGLRIVPAEPGWVRGAAWRDLRRAGMRGGGGDGGGGQPGGEDEHKMSPEEVMALPEIEFQGGDVHGAESDPSEGGNVESSGNGDSAGTSHDAVDDGGDEDTAPMDDTVGSSILSSRESELTAMAKGTAAADDDGNESGSVAEQISARDDKDQAWEREELSSSPTTTCTLCSICIDDFERGEKIRLLPRCRHAFHTDCILPWLTERQGRCPLCKTRVLVGENSEGEDEEREEGEATFVRSSEHEEQAVELTRMSQVNAHDDASGSSGTTVEVSAGDAESGENDQQILPGDATDDGVGAASRHDADEESGTDGGTEIHSDARRVDPTDRQ